MEKIILVQGSMSDLPFSLAKSAHSGSSYVPEKRATGEQTGWVEFWQAINEEFLRWVTAENKDELMADLERYKVGRLSRKKALLSAQSRHFSSAISGPSNYPVRQQKKRSDTAHKRLEELCEFDEMVLRKLRYKWNSNISKPINGDDADVIEQLQAKASRLVAYQNDMKKANRIVRSKKFSEEEKISKLLELERISSEEVAQEVLIGHYGKPGFPAYQLQNNNAKIKNTRKRLEVEIAKRDAPKREDLVGDGIRVFEDKDENRVKIEFDGKPSENFREYLHRQMAFRWSHNNMCWQRKLTKNGWRAAEMVFATWQSEQQKSVL